MGSCVEPIEIAVRGAKERTKTNVSGSGSKGEIKGAEFLRFECSKCSLCCHLWVPVTDADVRTLMSHISLPPQKIVQFVDSSRIQSTRGAITWIRFGPKKTEKKAMCLRERRDRCLFLESKKCIVYESRPGVCREHPFVLTLDSAGRNIKSLKLNEAANCAYTLAGSVSKQRLKKIHLWNLEQDEQYLKKVDRWNRRKHPGTEKDFLRYLGLDDAAPAGKRGGR